MTDGVSDLARELLDGGGPPAFKFEQIGTTVVGIDRAPQIAG